MLLAQAPPEKAPAKKGTGDAAGSLMNPDSLRAKAPDDFKVQFATTKGDFTVEVHRDWAPLGADRFYNLVKNGYYDQASFFRVVPNFVVQFGMNAKPALTQVWEKANIKDDPVKQTNKRGYLTFATAGPNTRTTQIFISLKDNAFLDGMGFSPFGEVTQGMDVVDKLYSGYGDPPRGPDQGRINAEGKAYLDKNFPMLDSIKTAKIVP
jgi:peptidyl-prolyl cis-trans isomerase A (cyclophilin A)